MTCGCTKKATSKPRRPTVNLPAYRGNIGLLMALSHLLTARSADGALRAHHLFRAETIIENDHPKLHRSIRAARVRLEMRRETPDFLALVKIIHIRREHAQ